MTSEAGAVPAAPDSSGRGGVVAGLVLLAVVLAAYAASLGGRFVWDDVSLVRDNPALADWRGLPLLFEKDLGAITGAEPEDGKGSYWRPLTLLSFFVDARFWGGNPFGFHLTNVLLHALVALLLFSLLRELGASPAAAALGASLHALHPALTESVAWISGRTDVLVAILFLAAARVYLREGPVLVVTALYVLAVFAKETALAIPAALLGLDAAFGRPRPLASRLARLVPLGAAAAAYFGVRFLVVGSFFPESGPHLDLGPRVLVPFRLAAAYFAKALFPVSPNAEWEPDPAGPFSGADALALAAALAALGFALARRRRGAAALPGPLVAALGVAAAFLLPALGIVPLPESAAERFLYLPLLGVPFLALLSRPRFAMPAAGVAALSFLAVTAARVPAWSDPLTLFADSAAKSGDHPRALFNLANEHHRQGVSAHAAGDVETARRHYDEALALYSRVDQLGGAGTEQSIIGVSQIQRASGRLNEAYETLRGGLERFPRGYGLLVEMGKVRIALGDEDAAIASLRRAVDVHPEVGEPYRLLGGLYKKPPRRDLATAQGFLEKAVEYSPADAEACQLLASTLAERSGGRDGAALDRALELFGRAVALDPRDVTSMEGMAKILVYAAAGAGGRDELARAEKAREILVEAIRIEGRASLYEVLAHASAKLGLFDEARHFLRVVIEAGPPDVEAWKAKLAEIDAIEKRYREGRPQAPPSAK